MKNQTKLILVKAVHSVIWVIMVAADFYILYAGITRTKSTVLCFAIALLGIESLVLLLNNWVCPLTPMAMKYTSDRSANFGIYLPPFIAKYNKAIFGTVFIVGLLLVIFY